MSTYEVVIIGAGPAGLFAVLSLDSIYLSLGASPENFVGDPDNLPACRDDLHPHPFAPCRHGKLKKILSRLQERLTGHVDIRTHCRAQRIMVKDTA